jgi:hypothetical protein
MDQESVSLRTRCVCTDTATGTRFALRRRLMQPGIIPICVRAAEAFHAEIFRVSWLAYLPAASSNGNGHGNVPDARLRTKREFQGIAIDLNRF